jgi:hypothetical protein
MMNGKTEQTLKVDRTGRVWTPLERREAALDGFERSGMPASKFAERIGVEVFDVCVVGVRTPQAAGQCRCRAGRARGACGVEVGGGGAGASQAITGDVCPGGASALRGDLLGDSTFDFEGHENIAKNPGGAFPAAVTYGPITGTANLKTPSSLSDFLRDQSLGRVLKWDVEPRKGDAQRISESLLDASIDRSKTTAREPRPFSPT